jgi:hypothetical protein
MMGLRIFKKSLQCGTIGIMDDKIYNLSDYEYDSPKLVYIIVKNK